jgi:hypothetical protein
MTDFRKEIFTIFSTVIISLIVVAMEASGELIPNLVLESDIFRIFEPMNVVFTVENKGNSKEEFYLYDDIFKTFFFELRTDKNDVVELGYNFLVSHKFYSDASLDSARRVITLMPGQMFSVKIDISRVFDISKPGTYFLRGVFSKDGLADRMEGTSTYFYKVTIKPPLPIEKEVVSISEELQRKKKEMYGLPPYEVVNRMLSARMRKDTEEFPIYFDLEKLIVIFPSFAKKYNEAPTPSEKTKVLQSFEEYLTTYWGDPIISYSIEKTEIERQEAKVTAKVNFKLRNTYYTLMYIYNLYQTYDNRWLIYSYDVINLK